ncbi:MAG: hypothetical protein J6X97_00730 [Lachnospiraceae bacterium]|nr:hypothetical protein [Lachnospiraceae bacterium]
MKKIYLIIGALVLALALLIGASVIIDKQLEKDSSFISDHIDFDKTAQNVAYTKPSSPDSSSGLFDMEVTEKVAKMDDVSKISDVHEVIPTDIGELKVEAGLSEEEWGERIALGINAKNINEANNECQGLFYYDNLDPSLKQLYLEIYIALSNYVESFYICSINPDDIDFAFNSVMGDHPEIYFTNGYMYTKYTSDDRIVKIDFTPAYTVSRDDVLECNKNIEAYRDVFLKGINQNTDDYTKIKYTYEFVILNTEYDVDSRENQNILSVFLFGKSVCQGYAKAFQYLSSQLGIQSTLVVGYVGANEGHAWNMVKCNGQYYYIDCTWGDSSYLENSMSLSSGGINYDYLNITTSELQLTHVIDNFTPLPPCNSMTDNYYVKEGLYFEGIDMIQLENAFNKAKTEGRASVELKCSDSEVYDRLGEYLLVENHIFDYLSSDKESVTYMQNKDLNIYSFPLR